jgi:hypothetical protein
MMIPARRKNNLLGLSVMGLVLGIVAILLPVNLIGTCASPTEICNTTMKPALTILGSLTIVSSLGAMVLSRKAVD